MTTSIEPQSQTAIVKAKMPPEIQAKIDERRAYNIVSAEIRGTQWGKDLGEQGVRAVVEYGRRHGIDPVTELEVLGGRIYKNVYYYRRKGAELMALGLIRWIAVDHVEADPRLDEIIATARQYVKDAGDDVEDATYWQGEAKAARREIVRRKNERVRVNANEKAAAVVVVKIATPWLETPAEGWNQAGVGKSGDPVGNAEPSKTAESRAIRRAWLNLVEAGAAIEGAAQVQAFVRLERMSDAASNEVDAVIEREAQQITAGNRSMHTKALTAGVAYDSEPVEPTPGREARRVTITEPLRPSPAMLAKLNEPDAYRGDDPAAPVPHADEMSDEGEG